MTAIRVQPDAGLESSERLHWLALDQLQGIGLLTFDLDLRFVSASGEALATCGVTAADLIGRRPSEVAGGRWAPLEDCFAQALAGSRDASMPVPWLPVPGVEFTANLFAVRDPDGSVIGGFLGLRTADAETDAHYRDVIEQSADMLTRHDEEGLFTYVSPGSAAIFGRSPAQLLGRHPLEFVHPDDLPTHDGIKDQLREHGRFEVEHRVVWPDGTCRWVQSLMRKPAANAAAVACVRDITAFKEQQARLTEATALFEQAFDQAPIGMALVDHGGRWMKVNRALAEITGYSVGELLKRGFADVTHPDDLRASVDALPVTLEAGSYEQEKRYIHADGHVIWVSISVSVVRDDDGEPLYFVTQTQDITESKRLQERLTHLAEHDSLTGLYNRRRFEAELEHQVALCARYGDTAALMVVDVDHFKYVNDSLGHVVGDDVISHVAQLLRRRLRHSDVVARLGGDEFGIILPRVAPERAASVAADVLECIESSPFTHGGHCYTLTVSAGVAMLDAATASAEDAQVSVDIALYDAKRQGRGRVATYSPETRADVLEGLTWSQRLKEALHEDGFELHAQPIVDLESGEAVIQELLVRLRSEDGELFPPASFLPAAARFGYMPAIDRWVIARAAAMAAARPGRRLAVNLASQTIGEPGLVAFVAEQLATTGAAAGDLVFELSEADVIANLDQARTVAEQLRALGAAVALDDFGSGFSGFSYLRALSVDLLKIDGQFVCELASNQVDTLILEAILHVANGMGLPTVAEYVTDAEVAARVRELGVTYGQGFHLGRPGPIEP